MASVNWLFTYFGWFVYVTIATYQTVSIYLADVDSDHLANSQEVGIVSSLNVVWESSWLTHVHPRPPRPTWQMEVSKGQGINTAI